MIDQHKTLSEKFLKKGFWLYLFSFIIAPVGYIIKIIISGELSVSEVGILYGVISLISIASAYNDLGMSESINHFIPKFVTEKRYDKVKTILVYAFMAQMFTGISIALFFYFGADWLSINYFKSETASGVLKVFSFYFLGINVMQILSMFFISIQNTFANKIIEFVRMGFTLILTLYFFYGNIGSLLNYSYAWIVGLYLAIVISIVIFYTKYFLRYFKKETVIWNKEIFIEIFKYALLVFIGAQAATILGQIDMQMIIYILGTTDAGYYTNYLSIIGIPFLIIGPVFSLLFPVFSEMHSKKEYKKISLIKEVFTNNFLLVGITLNLFLFTFSLPITYILFGEKFLQSGVILQYSILFLIFNFLLQINFNILAGTGKVIERAKIIGIAILINIMTNLLFIKILGAEGAALATGLGWMIMWVMSEYILKKDYPIILDWLGVFKNIFILGGASIFIFIYYSNFYNISLYLTQIQTFFILFALSLIYFCIFIGINYSTFKKLIIHIKEIKEIGKNTTI